MGVLTERPHEYWATVSGTSEEQLTSQQEAAWKWGVCAVEIRADLVPKESYKAVLQRGEWAGPTFVAHFGVADQAREALDSIERALEAGASGGICHSRCERVEEIRLLCRSAGAGFAAAYHSQEALTEEQAREEFIAQQQFQPLFRKIAVRAHRPEDAVALILATSSMAKSVGSPIVSAIFGPHRWARLALPRAGSSISFIVAERVANERGGDDEQLTLADVELLHEVRGLMPDIANSVSKEKTHYTYTASKPIISAETASIS